MFSSSARDEEQSRRRRKDPDRERDSTTSKDKDRSHRRREKASSSTNLHIRKHRSNSKDRDRDVDSPRSATSDRGSRKASIVPEMERKPSGEARPQTSYPAFSKVHSREAVGSREDISKPASPFTPEATDVGQEKAVRRHSTPANGSRSAPPQRAPPSPPLTAEDPNVSRSGSGGSMRRTAEEARSDIDDGRKSADTASRASGPAKASRSQTSLRKESRFIESDVSSMPGAYPEDVRRSTPDSYRRTVSTGSQPVSTLTQDTTGTGTDSDATSIAPERKTARINRNVEIIDVSEDSPPSLTDSQPTTPTGEEQRYPLPMRTKTPIIDVGTANTYTPGSQSNLSLDPKTPMTAVPAPPPPPPPPPLVTGAQGAPRVDYLLKYGGLPSMVPRRLVQNGNGVTGNGPNVQQYAMYQSPAVGQIASAEEYAKIFTPLHKRLDDYLQVLRHHGSLAVATGYKSVARRLLDKLSQVFARDISSQKCDCVICKTTPQPTLSDEEDSGVSWGEILEFVAGRRDLPQWPPFSITPESANLGLGLMNTMGVMNPSGAFPKPMQKLDVDVPEEYRDHYIRQNQKTKKAVQSWLSQQPELASSPPDEADEDTLMFAMMTKLDASQRNVFIALMHGQTSISVSRAPTPAERPQQPSDALIRARKALQRLYRLDRPPRDSECAIYMLHNAHLHGMLATLAEVNEAEWEILVSGRFDGFLWSGAEAPFPPSASQYGSPIASRAPSRAQNQTPFSRNTTPFSGMSGFQPSRGPTPFSPLRNVMSPDNAFAQQNLQPPMFPSRGPTPAFNGMGVSPPAPVQLDEDTEIAVLAEVERNLFNDMERFEDAFEVLHSRAEHVRQLLRERSAGLSMQSQLRRGSNGEGVHVRLDTPASGITDFESEGEGEDDDGLADLASLAPDDSASQISVNRRFRKRERQGKRTPAPVAVAEEDEGYVQDVPVHGHGHHHQHQHGGLPPPPPLPRQTSGRRSKY